MARTARPTPTRTGSSPAGSSRGGAPTGSGRPRAGSSVARSGSGATAGRPGKPGKQPRQRGGLRRRGAKVTAQVKQLRDVYQMTRRVDPSVTWWMVGAFVVLLALGLGIGFLTGHPLYAGFLGLLAGFLAALFVLARKAESAAYGQLEGQPGAAGAALRSLGRSWAVEEEPVAIDPRTRDTVFRALGRAGVVLVSDGPAPRVGKLLDGERRRVVRLLPDVPVHVFQSGRGEGQVPLVKLRNKVRRLRPTLTRQEVAEISKRLRALGGLRPPIPKGIDPMRARPDRRGARGR